MGIPADFQTVDIIGQSFVHLKKHANKLSHKVSEIMNFKYPKESEDKICQWINGNSKMNRSAACETLDLDENLILKS